MASSRCWLHLWEQSPSHDGWQCWFGGCNAFIPSWGLAVNTSFRLSKFEWLTQRRLSREWRHMW